MEDLFNSVPANLEPHIKMNEANEIIIIHEGTFEIQQSDKAITLEGKVFFSWFPRPGPKFVGVCIKINDDPIIDLNSELVMRFWTLTDDLENGEFIIDNNKFGQAHRIGFSSKNELNLSGDIIGSRITGDSTISVSKLKFVILNLREFYGEPTIVGSGFSLNRLIFNNDIYEIIVDKYINYDILEESLESNGGYAILYSGELTKKKGDITHYNIQETLNCFSSFISFLNGRRCSILFTQGIYEEEAIWTDYTPKLVDTFKYVYTWSSRFSIEGLGDLWEQFNNIWKKESDINFLKTVIHWYTEANSNSGLSEGSIVMSQVALELIYNWYLVETKKIILGKDAVNISAANKIRLLLSHINVPYTIPKSFTALQSQSKLFEDAPDGPGAIVAIRNAIIHSQEDKRKLLLSIDEQVKQQVLQLSIYYIELTLLYILNFKGIYFNRCSGATWAGAGEELVPWQSKH